MKIQGFALVTAVLVAGPDASLAEEGAAQAAPSVWVELNSAVQLEGACQLTFMMKNELATDIQSLVFETVLLTGDGAVDRLTLFDMRDLPRDIPRVRQFNVPDLSCEDLGMVLINGVSSCEGPEDCPTRLTSRIDVEFVG